jgi:TetR/AcrR family transcriptional regulator, ethionamide resistance regulator
VSAQAQRARQREQRENTRRVILDAAQEFLRVRPYRELTVDVVMADTGLTRTAFYRHFDDVTDLVLRVFAELGQELVAVADRWRATAGHDFPAPALEALTGIVDFFAQHGPVVRAIAEAAATDERIEQAYRQSLERFVDMTTEAFERLVQSGQLDVPDTRSLARALNLMNEAYLLNEFGGEKPGDPDKALATLLTVWVSVGAPAAGRN